MNSNSNYSLYWYRLQSCINSTTKFAGVGLQWGNMMQPVQVITYCPLPMPLTCPYPPALIPNPPSPSPLVPTPQAFSPRAPNPSSPMHSLTWDNYSIKRKVTLYRVYINTCNYVSNVI